MPPTPIPPEAVRKNLQARAEEKGLSLAYLSRSVGKSIGYLKHFMRGKPICLDEQTRLLLAIELDMDERLLGARDLWVPSTQLTPTPEA